MLFERCIFVSTVFCNWVSSSDAFTCFVSEILCMTVVSAWDFGGVVKAVSGDYIRWLSVSQQSSPDTEAEVNACTPGYLACKFGSSVTLSSTIKCFGHILFWFKFSCFLVRSPVTECLKLYISLVFLYFIVELVNSVARFR